MATPRGQRTITHLETLKAAKERNLGLLDGRKPNQRANQGVSLIASMDTLKADTIHRNSRRSSTWFRNKITKGDFDQKTVKERVRVGRMYTFVYQAKGDGTKALPHWDRHPLVIPIDYYTDGFLGLNLHYLHPKLRIILLNKLDHFSKGTGEQQRLAISYKMLKAASGIREFKPCIKRYLFSHTKTKFVQIPATEWELAAFMPLASFKGASKDAVYKESRDIINQR